jgi:hypothetical protein
MKKLLPLTSLLLLLSCGGQDQANCVFKGKDCNKDNPKASEEEAITEQQLSDLRILASRIKAWTLSCEGGIACGETNIGDLDSGDSLLWAGLLCAAGDRAQCSAAASSQNSSGQIFRNPGGSRGANDSSRDMFLGFLLYISTTKNQIAANKILSYIELNNEKLCTNASDNRCSVNSTAYSGLWGTMQKVWRHIGLVPNEKMNRGNVGDDTLINAESQFSSEGYPLHLVGVELFLRQITGTYSSSLENAANTLLNREPYNPFFEYIAKGKTQRAAQLILDKCPSSLNHTRKQWAWQRSESEQAWKQSKGWDCLFMIHLLSK